VISAACSARWTSLMVARARQVDLELLADAPGVR
jgi:hypothetical protein